MPKIELKTPVWSEGKLYRPGKAVDVPQALYAILSPSKSPAASEEAGSGSGEAYPSADLLAANGFSTWADVSKATDDELLAVDGIGQTRLRQIRAHKG